MWLFAATAIKYIDRHIVTNRKGTRLAVFEQITASESFGPHISSIFGVF
jgi:hypothetical protein